MITFQVKNNQIITSKQDNLIIYDINKQNNKIVKIPDSESILKSNLRKNHIDELNNEEQIINCVIISKDSDYIAVSTENKQVIIYNSKLTVIKSFLVPRVTSKLCFTLNNNILVADKTGDVFLFKLKLDDPPIMLFGHLSIILDLALSDCGKYIITCDRDEKIRVSHFPNAYNIVSYCLGHKEFVTNIKVFGKLLISSSGDGTIRFWNFIKGQQLTLINTNNYITDKKLLTKFMESMNKEKVFINTLPVINIQVYFDNDLFVAAGIHKYSAIQVFKINIKSFQSCLLNTIKTENYFLRFHLTNQLYVLNNSNINLYELTQGHYVKENCTKLEQFSKENKQYLEINDNKAITVLYKRRFDNLQDYLEKKKIRLELK